MLLQLIPFNVTCISFFLLGFISFINPSKVNIIANRWFGVFLVSVGCLMVNRIIYDTHTTHRFVRLLAFNELSRLAIAPALYLSVLHFTSPGKTFKRKELLHFMPFLLFFIYMLPVVLVKHLYFSIETLPQPWKDIFNAIIFLSVKTQLVVYWIRSYYKLNLHQKNIQLIASDIAPVNLNWLKYLLMGIAFMIALGLCEVIFNLKGIITYAAYGYLAATLFICYFLLAQKEVYPFEEAELQEVEQVINVNINNDEKAGKPRFTQQQANQLKNRLEHLMKNEKIFLDNELSLPQLAKQMNTTPHDLSYLLNDVLAVNFFQYVNGHRVEEAKQLLLSGKHKHLNILGIAYSAGFNSKTTFNTTFKKETGLSPSQFIKQAQNGGSPAVSY
jgi:AraC-like DNA-binding protein